MPGIFRPLLYVTTIVDSNTVLHSADQVILRMGQYLKSAVHYASHTPVLSPLLPPEVALITAHES